MHECCDVPVEEIMSNEHMPDGSCCLVTEVTDAPPSADCPASGTESKKIQHRTIENMVKPELIDQILDSQYYYCADPECSVVYFNQDSSSTFTAADLRVKVFAKDPGKDVYVCYCFDWTRGRIEEEIEETGTSTASRDVAEKMKAGNCECDIKNPRGVCCLGDINKFTATLQE